MLKAVGSDLYNAKWFFNDKLIEARLVSVEVEVATNGCATAEVEFLQGYNDVKISIKAVFEWEVAQ